MAQMSFPRLPRIKASPPPQKEENCGGGDLALTHYRFKAMGVETEGYSTPEEDPADLAKPDIGRETGRYTWRRSPIRRAGRKPFPLDKIIIRPLRDEQMKIRWALDENTPNPRRSPARYSFYTQRAGTVLLVPALSHIRYYPD